jgi:hypothetical protein
MPRHIGFGEGVANMDPTDVTQKMERERDPFDVVTEVIPRSELLEEGIEPASLDGGNESPKAA